MSNRYQAHLSQCLAVLSLLVTLGFNTASAQTPKRAAAEQQPANPTLVTPTERKPRPLAGESEMQCGGSIEFAPTANSQQVVGGEEEEDQNVYSSGDYVYINAGAQQGVRVGQEFSIVRPRGKFSSKFSRKQGTLGVYTQEVGRLSVINVKGDVSVARIENSCDTVLLGDLIRPLQERVAPSSTREEKTIDRFADPNGKQIGRIVLARESREMIARSNVVFVDLGTEDNIKQGDYLTVYRPVGTPRVARFRNEEIAQGRSSSFESDTFHGGKFSSKAQRTKNPTGEGAYNPPITSPEIKASRPSLPRKILGEAVVLSVQQRTATVMITRAAQEIHTGDFVELQ